MRNLTRHAGAWGIRCATCWRNDLDSQLGLGPEVVERPDSSPSGSSVNVIVQYYTPASSADARAATSVGCEQWEEARPYQGQRLYHECRRRRQAGHARRQREIHLD